MKGNHEKARFLARKDLRLRPKSGKALNSDGVLGKKKNRQFRCFNGGKLWIRPMNGDILNIDGFMRE